MGWTFEPTQLVPVAVAALLYERRVRTLRRRGRVPALARRLSFRLGLAVLVLALVSPLDPIGESRLFSVHMVQHVLIGDVAPLLLTLGLPGPILRPVLALRPLRHARALASPLVALPLWAADLWLWHVPALYDAALRNGVVHALEHACFLGGGLLLWSSLLGPLAGAAWVGRGSRLAALGAAWVAGGALANVFLWSDRTYYPPYVHARGLWGLTPLADQRAGGGVMLVEMMAVGAAAFVVLGLGWLRAAERRQLRLEAREG